MSFRYTKHYTREEARALLPRIQIWLKELAGLRGDFENQEQALAGIMNPGEDIGGPLVNRCLRTMAEIRTVLMEFQSREILVKDLDRGLIDFPSILGGKEIFLCWELGEDDVEFWHNLDDGYAGREKL
jgi:hypothetical protein